MERQLTGRARDAARAFTDNARNPDLRRAQLAFGGAWMSEWGFTVALSVVAFHEGGAGAVGLVALLRMVPAAILAPLCGVAVDRIRRERLLMLSSAIRTASIGAAAAVLAADGPIAVVYALAVVATIAVTPYRAAHSALLPALCRTAGELAACNVVRGMLDSASVLLGPLLAAGLLAWTSPAGSFAGLAAIAAASGLVLAGLRYEPPPRAPQPRVHLLDDALEGLRAVARDRGLTLLVGLGAVQCFTRGCLTVFTTVVAIDLLDTGEAGVGVLTAAMGAGAIAGSFGMSLVVGSRRMARWFGLGVLLWGAPLALIAALPHRPTALLALATIGLANAMLDVALFTVMARLADDAVLGRVFGVLETLVSLAVGIGAALTPLVIDLAGLRGALAVLGAVAPLAVAAAWRELRVIDDALDERDEDLDVLREVSLLRPLPMPTIEALARGVEHLAIRTGEDVCRQGDVGDRYYVIVDGDASVLDGERHVAELHSGEGFGEIALLRDVPRTSTVRAQSDLTLLAIDRGQFTFAVTGYTPSAAAAVELVETRLNGLRRGADPVT